MSSEPANGAGTEGLRVPSSDSPRPTSSSLKRNYSGKKEAMNGPLYRQTVNHTVLVRRLKRKGDGPSKQLARWFVENQIGMPSVCISSSHNRPPPRPSPTAARQKQLLQSCARHTALNRNISLHAACLFLWLCDNCPLKRTHVKNHLLTDASSSQASHSTYLRFCSAPTISSPNHSHTRPNLFVFNTTTRIRASMALALTTRTLSPSPLSSSPACELRPWSMPWLRSPSTWASARRRRSLALPSRPG